MSRNSVLVKKFFCPIKKILIVRFVNMINRTIKNRIGEPERQRMFIHKFWIAHKSTVFLILSKNFIVNYCYIYGVKLF